MNLPIGKLLGRNPPRNMGGATPDLVMSDTYLGLEFEVENFTVPAIPPAISDFWAIKEDHSLRNKGMEFVFSQPLKGDSVITALDTFLGWQAGTKMRTSIRTGLHVHLDMREVNVSQMVSFLMTYTAIEPLLYRWVGNSREESNFCVPFYYSDVALRQAAKIVSDLISDNEEASKGGPTGHAKQASEAFERYSGLNLNSLARFGSAEFRQMPMTFNRTRILDWINIILSLKKYSLQVSPDDVAKSLCAARYNVNNFARQCGGMLATVLPQFEVPSHLHTNACHSASLFSKIGVVRRWKASPSRFVGEAPGLKRYKARAKKPEVAPPAPEPNYWGLYNEVSRLRRHIGVREMTFEQFMRRPVVEATLLGMRHAVIQEWLGVPIEALPDQGGAGGPVAPIPAMRAQDIIHVGTRRGRGFARAAGFEEWTGPAVANTTDGL